MAKARKHQVNVLDTKYYHCTSRCVRRAFLCGDDPHTRKNFDHRRKIIEQRLLLLSSVYAIEVFSYAIMSNHLHLVLKVCPNQASNFSEEDIISRWHTIHLGHEITRKYLREGQIPKAEQSLFNKVLEQYRERLASLSWFMRDLNEYIARVANSEDNCTGHFWEGRFTSQALLDEKALLTCMAYVDLNPIRSKAAKSLQDSEFTSIKKRIEAAKNNKQPFQLSPFIGTKPCKEKRGIRFNFIDYLNLVEVSGKVIKDNKGFLPKSSNILDTLAVDSSVWLNMMKNFEAFYGDRAGSKEELQRYYFNHHFKRRPDIANNTGL